MLHDMVIDGVVGFSSACICFLIYFKSNISCQVVKMSAWVSDNLSEIIRDNC